MATSTVHFSSKSDCWETPQDLFDRLNDEFEFTTDVCAEPHNKKCERYFSPEADGLAQEWSGVCWCNPPYSDSASWIRYPPRMKARRYSAFDGSERTRSSSSETSRRASARS